jgi:Cu(I)/Ag(I) efflux system membrane fusion protein
MKIRFLKLFAVGLFMGATAIFIVSCKRDGASLKPADVDYYTCTMHPSVKSQDPKGKCPICSMDLVPVMKRVSGGGSGGPGGRQSVGASERGSVGTAGAGERASVRASERGSVGMDGAGDAPDPSRSNALTEFSVPLDRQQLIGVTYAKVEKRPFHHVIRSFGMVAYDKQRHWDYVARVDGYVKKLFVFSRGELLEKDAPILSLYSPDLLSTQNEFVNVLKSRDDAKARGNPAASESAERLVESARQRLRLWNISDEQIGELEKTRKPQELLTLQSPFKGVVQDLAVDQGRRVAVGDHLVDIADLSVVWVWTQFYQDELPMLKKGLPVTVTTASYPGEKFTGKLSVIDPFINDALRTGRVRIDLENPDMKFQPDMYVDVEVAMDMGEGLAVPVLAVLPTGKHNIVFVDKGAGRLEPRYVVLGRKVGEFYQVKSGLKESERVVTSANFLIDAEAKIQGGLGSW